VEEVAGTIILKKPLQNTASSIFKVFDITIPNIRVFLVYGLNKVISFKGEEGKIRHLSSGRGWESGGYGILQTRCALIFGMIVIKKNYRYGRHCILYRFLYKILLPSPLKIALKSGINSLARKSFPEIVSKSRQ
jgi:hypothetical protein